MFQHYTHSNKSQHARAFTEISYMVYSMMNKTLSHVPVVYTSWNRVMTRGQYIILKLKAIFTTYKSRRLFFNLNAHYTYARCR